MGFNIPNRMLQEEFKSHWSGVQGVINTQNLSYVRERMYINLKLSSFEVRLAVGLSAHRIP